MNVSLRLIFSSAFSFIMVIGNAQQFKTRYRIISEEKYADKLQNIAKVSTKRYVLMPMNVNRPAKILKNAYNQDSLLSACFELIFQEGFKDMERIQNSRASEELKIFAKGCIYLQEEDFKMAESIFSQDIFEKYKFYTLLLLADCKYDTKKEDPILGSFDYYQAAFDMAPNSTFKDLVKHRVNFIRYK